MISLGSRSKIQCVVSPRVAEGGCWLWAQHTGEPLRPPHEQLTHRQPAEPVPAWHSQTCWLHMCAQARGIFGCCNLHSSSVGAMLINLLSLCEVYLVLLTREETAISRQHRQMFFFFHRLQISPEFSENVSGSHANCAQKSHLKHFCPCTENFVRMLSESIQLGRRWVCIISPCTPVLLPACPSVTLWGKSCLHSTPSSEVFHRNYTLKLPILVTQQLTPLGDQEADFNRHKQEWGAHIFLMLETWLLYIWISTACPRS